MTDSLIFVALSIGAMALFFQWRRTRARSRGRQRLGTFEEQATPVAEGAGVVADRPFLTRYRFIPWIVGISLAALVYVIFGWAFPFIVAIALITSLMGL